MPRGVKRQRHGINCDGCGCGQPGCTSCFVDLDDGLFGGRVEIYQPSQQRRAAAMPQAEGTAGAAPKTPSARDMVNELDPEVLRDLIAELAPRSTVITNALDKVYTAHKSRPRAPAASNPRVIPTPAVAVAVAAAPTPRRAAVPLSQMRPVVAFDRYSKDAWHALNDRAVLRRSGGKQYDRAGEVWSDILGCVEAISEGTKDGSPLRTKQNAVETLRKITKTAILGEGTLGHEVRKQLQTDSSIADVMGRVLRSMSSKERVTTGQRKDEKGTLVEKVRWVKGEAESYCLKGLVGLDGVLEMLETGRDIISLD